MKKVILAIIIVLLCIISVAQVPESFSYQAIVRDISNNPLTNQNVSFRMSILKGSISGSVEYTELHSATTNDLGLVTLAIGNGTDKTGDFTTITWGSDIYFLKVEIDPAGGTDYDEMGTTQLLSVPYALYAEKVSTQVFEELMAQIEELQIAIGLKVFDFDGNEYKTIKIGSQIWMAENLRTTHYPDGTPITLVSGDTEWGSLADTENAFCYYNDNTGGEADIYGSLYTWGAAMHGSAASSENPSGVQGVCPDGWHLPSVLEWIELKNYLGTDNGGKLKEEGTAHWNDPNFGADNSSGFTALPGGERFWIMGTSRDMGIYAYFWQTNDEGSKANFARLTYSNAITESSLSERKSSGYSVRCVMD